MNDTLVPLTPEPKTEEDSFLTDPEPWDIPVDGAALLDELTAVIRSHVIAPNGAAEATALWLLFTYAHDCFEFSPVLGISSPAPECGKTTLLTAIELLARRSMSASNISPSSVFRAVEKWGPTLLIDEADTFLRDNEELRGILNCGHRRSSCYVIRNVGDKHEPKRFKVWSPKAIALIGKLPPTLASRAILIELRRKTAAEKVESLRFNRTSHLKHLPRQALRWATDHAEELTNSEPRLPSTLNSRVADNWNPLIAIADAAGGEWPARARRIAETMSARRSEDTAPIMVLEDIRRVFVSYGRESITTQELVTTLGDMEDRPWSEWRSGKPITPRQLARLLEPFGIAPCQYWDGGKHRGYELAQFADSFSHYLGAPSGILVEPAENGQIIDVQSGRPGQLLPDQNANEPQNPNESTIIPFADPEDDANCFLEDHEGCRTFRTSLGRAD